MPENTFDIVSKIDLQEVSNAIQQALKEVHTRFDLKDSKSNIEMDGKEAIVLHSIDDYKLKAVNDIFQAKLWSASAARIETLCRRSSPYCDPRILALICSLQIIVRTNET